MSQTIYPKPLSQARVATDIAIFTMVEGYLNLLLIERSGEPFEGLPSLPGGMLWEGETTFEAATRILCKKAGVEDVFIEQLYTFDDPARDPRGPMISVAYYALVPHERLVFHEGPDLQKPFLAPIGRLPKLAFDHDAIVAYALGRLRAKLSYSNAAYSLLPQAFTLSQLQGVYEAVLGTALDKRNFRKKFLSLGLIEPTEEVLSGERHRPARLYRFKRRQPQELPSPFV